METTQKTETRILILGLALLFCVVVTVQALAQGQGEGPKPSSTGWQHLALTHTIGQTSQGELGKSINKVGREGWQLVSVANVTEAGTTTKTIFYFKKPL